MVKPKVALFSRVSRLTAFFFVFLISFVCLTFYLPNDGFVNGRDGLMNMEYAKYQLSHGLALDGFWSYTLNEYHPTPFYHIILIVGGFFGKLFVSNFDTGALAFLISIELALLTYSAFLFSRHFKYRMMLFLSMILGSIIMLNPLRKDRYIFAEPHLNYVNINLNFVTISIVSAWLLAMHLMLTKYKNQRLLPIFILSALFTGYMPFMLSGIAFFVFFFLKDFINLKYISDKMSYKNVNNTLDKSFSNAFHFVENIDMKYYYKALVVAFLPYFLIVIRVVNNGLSSLFPDTLITNASGTPTTFSELNYAIKFHLYGLSAFVYYIFLLLVLLTIIYYLLRLRNISIDSVWVTNTVAKLFWLLLSNLALIAFIFAIHPGRQTLYMSTFFSFIGVFSCLAYFYLIVESLPSSLGRPMVTIFLISLSILTLMHLGKGGLEVALNKTSERVFAYRPEEIEEFELYLQSQEILPNQPYRVYYNHDDYNLTMIAPILLKWLEVNGYNVCIMQEPSLPSFSCPTLNSNVKSLEFSSDLIGFKSKHLDVFNPVAVKEISGEDVLNRYPELWRGSWPPISELKILK